MNTHLTILCIILLCIFPIILSTCPSSKCSDSGPTIRSPFQSLRPSPTLQGFDLSCTTKSLTTLTLPNSGHFYVRDIDYYHQQIILYDPQNCTPNRLMNLNLSNSPFDINYHNYRNYTFLSCPTDLVRPQYATILCLSNSTTSTLATANLSLAKSMPNSCTIIATTPLPVSSWPYLDDQTGFISGPTQDFRLSWNITACLPCEMAGGFCQVNQTDTAHHFGCDTNCQTGTMQRDFRVFKLVVLFFTIPAVTFTVTVAIYFWYIDQRRRHRDWVQARAAGITMHTNSSARTGLDEVTIESYEKMVVGESKRIPGPNNIACPICLADYCPKDTLRSIPDCHHCFHAECVDEWLRANPSCPVCRNSPSHA